MVRDRELEVGARAHYDDPDYYTHTYKKRIDDVQFYVDLGKKIGGPVLEYGAGNGRIALALARHGVSVTGVDHSKEMIRDFRARLKKEDVRVQKRVDLRQGDMRSLQLKKRFPLVLCTFNTALHLYTRDDVERFFARVKEHLKPGGSFVCDLSIPALGDLTRPPGRAYKAPSFTHPSAGRVRYEEYFDYDSIRQIMFVSMNFDPIDGSGAFSTPLAHRQFFPREWEALLHYNGFRVERVSGDFYGGPLDRTSDVMVWHAKVANGNKRSKRA